MCQHYKSEKKSSLVTLSDLLSLNKMHCHCLNKILNINLIAFQFFNLIKNKKLKRLLCYLFFYFLK